LTTNWVFVSNILSDRCLSNIPYKPPRIIDRKNQSNTTISTGCFFMKSNIAPANIIRPLDPESAVPHTQNICNIWTLFTASTLPLQPEHKRDFNDLPWFL
jgi:hypothetical protein